jgi:hypothetical protein
MAQKVESLNKKPIIFLIPVRARSDQPFTCKFDMTVKNDVTGLHGLSFRVAWSKSLAIPSKD